MQELGDGADQTLKNDINSHADQWVSTINLSVLDGRNLANSPASKVDPHNKAYADVEDLDKDIVDLVATCQRHTRCSGSYCLGTKHGKQECRLGYPKPLQPQTAIITDDELILFTAQNDGLINRFSCLHANVDVKYIVSRQRVLQYCTKHITKIELWSQSLREIFTAIVCSLQEGNTSSAQETCHLLLQVPMFKASCDFIILSLDGSRAVEDYLQEG